MTDFEIAMLLVLIAYGVIFGIICAGLFSRTRRNKSSIKITNNILDNHNSRINRINLQIGMICDKLEVINKEERSKAEGKIKRLHMLNDMNDGKLERLEKEKFKEYMKEFTKAQIEGWMLAISYILLMNEANKKLCAKLFEMFDICIDVIRERSDNNECKTNEEASKKTDRHTSIR